MFQDENLAAWRKAFGGAKQHGSILGRVKAKLVNHPRVTVLPRFVATTKTCACGAKNVHTLAERTYRCGACGYVADRDTHAARNMIRLALMYENTPVVRREALVETEEAWTELKVPTPQSLVYKREASRSSA